MHGLALSLDSLKNFMKKTLLFVQVTSCACKSTRHHVDQDKDIFKHLRGSLEWLERKDFLRIKRPEVFSDSEEKCESVFVEATALGQVLAGVRIYDPSESFLGDCF